MSSAMEGPAILNIAAKPRITGRRLTRPNRQSNRNSMTIMHTGVVTAADISGSWWAR